MIAKIRVHLIHNKTCNVKKIVDQAKQKSEIIF